MQFGDQTYFDSLDEFENINKASENMKNLQNKFVFLKSHKKLMENLKKESDNSLI